MGEKTNECDKNGIMYEYRCCNDNCQKPCKQDEDTRGGIVVGGILMLIVFVFIFTPIFSCGIVPCCCFAKDMPDQLPPAGYAQPIPMQGIAQAVTVPAQRMAPVTVPG